MRKISMMILSLATSVVLVAQTQVTARNTMPLRNSCMNKNS